MLAVLHGEVADPSTRTLYARCRACCEACMGLAEGDIIVDILNYSGVSCRIVSGWKHSSTKASLAGVITLEKR